MSWASLFKAIKPYILYIETPECSGTAFFFAYNQTKTVVGFATAAHVVERADDSKQPIKLVHCVTKKELFVTDNDRVIFLDRKRDSASIMLFGKVKLGIPKDTLLLMDASKVLPIGVEVAWAGFPLIARPNLCFFTGRISARLDYYDSYLIDSVAIPGVCGGPLFYSLAGSTQKNAPKIIGTVTGYMPNRIHGDTLPRLLRVQNVTSFHETIKAIKSLDEAKEKRVEQAQKEASQSRDTSSNT